MLTTASFSKQYRCRPTIEFQCISPHITECSVGLKMMTLYDIEVYKDYFQDAVK